MLRTVVLLSTFNGEKYLEELLQSLIRQTYPSFEVWIRDDGSTDHTLEIIRKYTSRDWDGKRFFLYEDHLGNLRTGRSLIEVMKAAGSADVYLFCDQDDIWGKNKVRRAVEKIASQDPKECILYSAGYHICDEDLKITGRSRRPAPFEEMNVGRSFYNYGAGLGQGFTMAINARMRERAFVDGYDEIRGHDVWLWAVVSGLHGVFLYDDYPSAKYRRHASTVSETGKGKLALWEGRWKQFLDVSYFARIARGVDTYRRLFEAGMTTKEDRAFLKLFGHYSDFGKHRLRKALYPYRLKLTWPEELVTRFAFLCGRA